jgi:hypothetical protein
MSLRHVVAVYVRGKLVWGRVERGVWRGRDGTELPWPVW